MSGQAAGCPHRGPAPIRRNHDRCWREVTALVRMRPTCTRRWWRARSGQVMQMAAGPGPEFPDTRADGSGPFRLPTCYGTGADPPASGPGGSSPSSPTAPSSTGRSSPRRRSKRAATAAAPRTSSRCTRHPPRRAPRNRTPPAVSCRPRTRSPGSRSGSGPDLARLSAQVGRVPDVIQAPGTDSFGAGFGQSSPGMMPDCSAAAPVPVAWLSRRPHDRGHQPSGEEL